MSMLVIDCLRAGNALPNEIQRNPTVIEVDLGSEDVPL